MRMKLLSTITAAALALAAAPAVAQLAQDTNAPVDITADELEVINTECVSIWRGNALTARFRTKAGGTAGGTGDCGDLLRMEAQGQVYYATPQQRVRADNAVYEATGETLTMTGDVVAVQGQNVLRGTRMVINTRTGQGTMQGAATGRNKTGRVRGVFYPNQQSNPARP
jgi:lipopolysaccharide export system protein LptA